MIDLRAAQAALLFIESQTPRLSDVERKRAARFADDGQAREWLAAHIALRLVLESVEGIAISGAEFARSASGRPSLPGASIDFSLSHAARHALIAVTSSGSIGVDIEGPRQVRLQVDRRVAIETAGGLLATQPLAAEGVGRFLQAWVRLEALAKAEGTGMARILSRAGAYGPRRGKGASADLLPRGMIVKDLPLGSGLYGAVAMPAVCDRIQLGIMPTSEAGLRRFPLA